MDTEFGLLACERHACEVQAGQPFLPARMRESNGQQNRACTHHSYLSTMCTPLEDHNLQKVQVRLDSEGRCNQGQTCIAPVLKRTEIKVRKAAATRQDPTRVDFEAFSASTVQGNRSHDKGALADQDISELAVLLNAHAAHHFWVKITKAMCRCLSQGRTLKERVQPGCNTAPDMMTAPSHTKTASS